MVFSAEWEELYKNSRHLSVWPWSDAVSLVMRHARPASPDYSALELGCGAGANIPFFQRLGIRYHAVEGSATMVELLKRNFPEYAGTIAAGDFTKDLVFEGPFDLVLDRGSLTCNTTEAIANCLAMVRERLKPGGKFIGIDWMADDHSESSKGVPDTDGNTRSGYADGPFAGIGRIHFSSLGHLRELFSAFAIETVEHKIVETVVPAGGRKLCYYSIVASKKA